MPPPAPPSLAADLVAAVRKAAAAMRTFRGAALAAQTATDLELVLTGPAGTGKSLAILHKLHRICETYERARVLILRETRVSLTESGLVTFEEKVLPADHPVLFGAHGQRIKRQSRTSYDYPKTGASIVLGGMDEASRLFSTEFDVIYWQEVTEGRVSDWESLFRALRNNRLPYRQVIADCNPTYPKHWVKQRANEGRLRLLESRHEDNPAYFDAQGRMTLEGRDYIEGVLDKLTGVRKDRLRFGRWVAAEGTVYEFDRAIHVIPRQELPTIRRYFASIDFGYTHPFVWQLWGEDNDGRLYLVREIYRTQRTVRDHAAEIRRQSLGVRIEATVADHDAEDRATLNQEGIPTIGAQKAISTGVQAVETRLRKAGDGRPRLMLVEDALSDRDEVLAAALRPACTADEFDVYLWPKDGAGTVVKEKPVDKDNHGMDAMRYAVMYVDAETRFASAPMMTFPRRERGIRVA